MMCENPTTVQGLLRHILHVRRITISMYVLVVVMFLSKLGEHTGIFRLMTDGRTDDVSTWHFPRWIRPIVVGGVESESEGVID